MALPPKVYSTKHSTGNVFRDEANFYRFRFKILQVICKETKISMSYYIEQGDNQWDQSLQGE
jgi:hypothetical protein